MLKPVVDPTQMETCSHCLQLLPVKNFIDAQKYVKVDDKVKYRICNDCCEQGYRPDNIEEIPLISEPKLHVRVFLTLNSVIVLIASI